MQQEWLAERFEEERRHLFGVAYRMLGSASEAEDAVQDTWLRLSRSDAEEIDNIGGWLTTVVARVCLNMLRSRNTRGEVGLEDRLPEPTVVLDDGSTQDPAERAMLADSVSIALLVVLDQLSPDERLAFVLHDLFAVPFDEIATMLDRSSDSTRQLASRARRRVRGRSAGSASQDRTVAAQREVVDAFFAAAQDGDLDRLIGALHPEVVLRADLGAGITTYRGAAKVAGNAVMYAHADRVTHPALVNGRAGVAVTLHDRLFSVMAFTVVDGRITEIEAYAAPAQVAKLAASMGMESAHS
ncbi:sigma-70 family RNA polymerase sigma factor [Nocardioides sp. CCNWLW239]|uniref:sigma-70 family RNA polymerase sigma factor n=1 Tax=Nocardioides sp. CCNWLW239 TaxID=3128902 RepID=UPI0030173A8B